jgi:hypothetical protein
MTTEQFVDSFEKERTHLLSAYLTPGSDTQVANDIAALRLSEEQSQVMARIVGGILRDTFYTILLGLDGAASIGGRQEIYDLRAEDGTRLTGTGNLEALAYKAFHDEA